MALMILMLMLKGIMFKSNQDDQCSLIMVIRSSNERGSESFPQLLSRSFTDQGPSMPLLLKFIIIGIILWFDTIIISHRMMTSYKGWYVAKSWKPINSNCQMPMVFKWWCKLNLITRWARERGKVVPYQLRSTNRKLWQNSMKTFWSRSIKMHPYTTITSILNISRVDLKVLDTNNNRPGPPFQAPHKSPPCPRPCQPSPLSKRWDRGMHSHWGKG